MAFVVVKTWREFVKEYQLYESDTKMTLVLYFTRNISTTRKSVSSGYPITEKWVEVKSHNSTFMG